MKDDELLEICKIIFTTDTFSKKKAKSVGKFLKKCLESTHSEVIKKYLKHFMNTHECRWKWMA